MPKNSPELNAKRAASRKESEARHIFDLCGWDVLIDPLNYQIKNGDKRYYWSTFSGMLKGLKEELDIKSVKNSKSLDDAIERVDNNGTKFIKDLKAVLASYTSLGKLEWH